MAKDELTLNQIAKKICWCRRNGECPKCRSLHDSRADERS